MKTTLASAGRVLIAIAILGGIVTGLLYAAGRAPYVPYPQLPLLATAALATAFSAVFVLGLAMRPRPETGKFAGFLANVDAVTHGLGNGRRRVTSLPKRVWAWWKKPKEVVVVKKAKPKRKSRAKKPATTAAATAVPTTRPARKPRRPVPVVASAPDADDTDDDTDDDAPAGGLAGHVNRFAASSAVAAKEATAIAAAVVGTEAELLDVDEPGIPNSERVRRSKHNKAVRKAQRRALRQAPAAADDDGDDVDGVLDNGSLVGGR